MVPWFAWQTEVELLGTMRMTPSFFLFFSSLSFPPSAARLSGNALAAQNPPPFPFFFPSSLKPRTTGNDSPASQDENCDTERTKFLFFFFSPLFFSLAPKSWQLRHKGFSLRKAKGAGYSRKREKCTFSFFFPFFSSSPLLSLSALSKQAPTCKAARDRGKPRTTWTPFFLFLFSSPFFFPLLSPFFNIELAELESVRLHEVLRGNVPPFSPFFSPSSLLVPSFPPASKTK